MSGAIVTGVGSAVVGGIIASRGAKSAARTQAAAANRATSLQMQIWQDAQQNLRPFLEAGKEGLADFSLFAQKPWHMHEFGQMRQHYGETLNFEPTTQQAASGIQDYSLSDQQARAIQDYNLTSGQRAREIQQFQQSTPNFLKRLGDFRMGDEQLQNLQDFQLSDLPDASFTVNPITGQVEYGGPASASQQELSEGGVLSPSLPDLPGQVDFEFDTEDPVYQHKLSQMNEQVNRQLAAKGLSDSRAGMDVLADANMRLIGEEADKQYGRQTGERDYLADRAATLYGMGEQRGDTLYNRLYGQQGDLYNRLYGQTMSDDARLLNLTQSQLGATAQQDLSQFGILQSQLGAQSAADAQRMGFLQQKYGTMSDQDQQYMNMLMNRYNIGANQEGRELDLLQTQLGTATGMDAQQWARIMDQYNMNRDMYGMRMTGLQNLVNTGLSSQGMQNQMGYFTGQAVGSNMADAAAAQAGAQLANSNMWGNVVSGAGAAVGGYLQNQPMQQPMTQGAAMQAGASNNPLYGIPSWYTAPQQNTNQWNWGY